MNCNHLGVVMLWHLLNIIMVLPVLWVFLNCLPCSADGTSRLRILAINCAYHQEEMKNFMFIYFIIVFVFWVSYPSLKSYVPFPCQLALSLYVEKSSFSDILNLESSSFCYGESHFVTLLTGFFLCYAEPPMDLLE